MQHSNQKNSAANKATAPARDLANGMTEMASEIAHEGYEMVASKARLVADTAEKAYDGGTNYVKENPGKALLGAAAVGFLAALWFRRK